MAEIKVDERTLSGIEVDIVIMEECRHQLRSKEVGRKAYVGRQITGEIHRG